LYLLRDVFLRNSIKKIVFKVFKIPVNKWSVTTAVLGGVVMIGTLLMGMAYFHPGSRSGRVYFVTTGIVPNVRGKVIEIDVTPNEPVKKGEVLFKIDPTPYQAKVDEIKAQLEFAQKRLEDTKRLLATAGGSKFDVYEWENKVATAKAQLAAGQRLPQSGTVFISVRDADKQAIVEPARMLHDLGFTIIATGGTQRYLEEHGVPARRINTVSTRNSPLCSSGDVSVSW